MGAEVPKQFIPVGGLPILMRTIMAFHGADEGTGIIVVIPEACHEQWRGLCLQHGFALQHELVAGGASRFYSVKNGLSLVPDDAEGVVAVHDGVRPFATKELIDRCFLTAEREGTAIPVIPVVETLRQTTEGGGSRVVNRKEFCLVQTPQVFQIGILKEAYRQPFREEFTDDASVVEAAGHSVTLVEGERRNIKITTPSDLSFAEFVCRQ